MAVGEKGQMVINHLLKISNRKSRPDFKRRTPLKSLNVEFPGGL